MATPNDVSDIFKVTRGISGVMVNAKVNIARLYVRQIRGTNQSVVVQPSQETGLGATGVSNWEIYDGPGSRAKQVGNGQGMFTHAGSWNQWFTLVFNDNVPRFKGSSLQVMGANDNDDEEENEWAIVGGTGEFAMAQGTIKRRQYSEKGNIIKQELTVEFFCHMKVVPAPKKSELWGRNGSFREMEGKSQRLQSLTLNYYGTIHSIQFSYIDEEGRIRNTAVWGETLTSPGCKTETFTFGPSELVKQISGTAISGSSFYLSHFQIVTNQRTLGPFGTDNGTTLFNYSVPEGETVVGFFAKIERSVQAIGIYTI